MEQVGDVFVASNSHNQIMMIRGKRTKRPRPPSSPLSLTMAIACSSSSSVVQDTSGSPDDGANVSPTTSSSTGTAGIITDQQSTCLLSSSSSEEDMANCLILLAQGSTTTQKRNKLSAGLYDDVYRCTTCDKSFSSFQALGGHTASHKKLKPESYSNNNTPEDQKATWHFSRDKIKSKTDDEEDRGRYMSFSNNSSATANTNTNTTLGRLSLKTMTNNRNCRVLKVHECGICGAEFSSGQALGGHMRRHRSFTSSASSTNPKMITTTMMSASASSGHLGIYIPKNGLSVDLNLPAPEAAHPAGEMESPSKKFLLLIPNSDDQSTTSILSTKPVHHLVDCPY